MNRAYLAGISRSATSPVLAASNICMIASINGKGSQDGQGTRSVARSSDFLDCMPSMQVLATEQGEFEAHSLTTPSQTFTGYFAMHNTLQQLNSNIRHASGGFSHNLTNFLLSPVFLDCFCTSSLNSDDFSSTNVVCARSNEDFLNPT